MAMPCKLRIESMGASDEVKAREIETAKLNQPDGHRSHRLHNVWTMG